MMLKRILEKVLGGSPATVDEALALNEICSTEELCDAADEVRRHRHGDVLDTCSIMNARSGHCTEDCKWCAQSRHYSTGVREYDSVTREEAVAAAKANRERGVGRFSLVTSGRKVSRSDIGHFCDMYRAIGEVSDICMCASMGLLGREELQALKDVGVRRYHCNLETSSEYFPSLCSSHTHDDKLRTIALAREVGLEVCCGGIIGMGESLRDRLLLAEEARNAGAVSIPVNILQPIKGTPLENTERLSGDEVARSVALMRLVAPDAVLRFAGGRAQLPAEITERILLGGMNGAMIGDLLTTVGNKVAEDYELFARLGYEVR